MDYIYRPKKNGTVVIFGAGASYGSSLENKPPVMRDFIRIGKNIVSEDYSDLWSFLSSIGYPSSQLDLGSPNLEELYSILHTLSKGLWHEDDREFIAEIGQAFWKVPPVNFLESFIIEVTDISSLEALKKTCSYHDYVVSQLSKGDTVISFNYDLIADASIAKTNQWSEFDGYGFTCFELLKDKHYENKYSTENASEIAILKPHGSLNWKPNNKKSFKISTDGNEKEPGIWSTPSFRERLNPGTNNILQKIEVCPLYRIENHAYQGLLGIKTAHYHDRILDSLPQEDHWKVAGVQALTRDTFIIPPSINKFGDSSIPEDLVLVWKVMRNALETAQTVIIIGYSFPPLDLEFNTLFRLSMKNNQAKDAKILIVNLDKTIIDRIRQMAPSIKVEHIANTLKDYVEEQKRP